MNEAIFLLGDGVFIRRHLAERVANAGRRVIAATRRELHFNHTGICSITADNGAARTAFG